MEYNIQVFAAEELVIEQITGEITLEGLLEKTKALLGHPDYDNSFVGVLDMRKAVTRMSKEELHGFEKFLHESGQFKGAKWALLGNDPLLIALSQVFQQRIPDQDLTIGVFGDVGSAAQFIGKSELLQHLSD